MDINTTLPLKTDKVQWPTTAVTVRRKKKYKTRYSKDDNDNNLFDLDAININRNELLIWSKASLSLDAYLQKRYAESLETIIPPNMRPSHMRLYAHETYIDMITKLQNDIHNNKSFYNNINVIKVSDMMKRPLLHGEQVVSIIDGVVRKIRFCAIELIDKFLRNSIKPLYTLCREAAILSEHIIYEIRKIIEEVLLALINIYRSVGHLNLEKVVYLGEIESLSKLLTTVCNSGEETEDEKSIKRELDDNDNEINNNKTNNNENANNNDLVAELVERFGIPADDVDAILQKYSYSRRNQKKKRQKSKEKTFVTAVNELKKVDEGDKEDDNSDNDNENEDESDEESNIETDDDDEDENEHMSRVSESLVDESMHIQVNFEQTLLHLGEESQKYQIGLANAVKQSRLDKTEEARKTFLGGHKLLKDLNIETEEVIKLRKQVDNINRMHIATLEQQIKIMQSQLEKVKESILTPKEKEILRLKKMERELEQHVHDWVTKHKDHHGRILRRNLLLYYLKYRFAKRKLNIAATRIQRVVRKGMVILLLRKNMKRIYKEIWADKVIKDNILLYALYKRLKHKKARLLQKAMRRFILRYKFKKILYASRKILMQRTSEIIGSVVSEFDKRMKIMELFLVNCIPEDIVANVRVKVFGDYNEVKARKETVDETHPFWKEMELIRKDIKQLRNRLIVTENKTDTMKYAVTTSLRAEKFNYEYDDFVVDNEFEQWQKEKKEIKMKKIEKMEEIIYEKIKIKKDNKNNNKNNTNNNDIKKRRSRNIGSKANRRLSVNSIGTDDGRRRSSITSGDDGNDNDGDIIPNSLTADDLKRLQLFMKSDNDGSDSDDASSVSSIGSFSSIGSKDILSQSASKTSIVHSGSSSLLRKGSNGALNIGKKKKSASSINNINNKKKHYKKKKKKVYGIDVDDDDYPETNENFKSYDDMVQRGKWINKEKLLQRVENLNQFSIILKKVYEENDMVNFKETAISIKELDLFIKEEEQDERDIADDKRKRSFQGISNDKRSIISDGESLLLKGIVKESKNSLEILKKSQLEILSEKLIETNENFVKDVASKKVESTINIDENDINDSNDNINRYQNFKYIQLLPFANIPLNDLDNAPERKPRKAQWVNRIIEDSINQIFIMLTNLRLMPMVSADEAPPVPPLGMDYTKNLMNEYELVTYTCLINGLTPPCNQLLRYELNTRKPFVKPSKAMLLNDSMRKGYNGVLSKLPEKLQIDNTSQYQEKRTMHLDEDMQEIDVVELSIAGATKINCTEMLGKAISLIRGIDLTSDVVLDLISVSNFDDNSDRKNLNMPPLELLNNLTSSKSNGSSLIFSLFVLKLCTIVENRPNQDKTLTNIPDRMSLSNAIKILQYIYVGIPFKKCKPAKIVIQSLDTYPIAFQQLILKLLSIVGITMPLNSSGVVVPINASKKISFIISDPLAMLEATAEVPETNITTTYEEHTVNPHQKHVAHPPQKSKPSTETLRIPSLRHVNVEQEELSTIIRNNINNSDDNELNECNTDMIFTENASNNLEQLSPNKKGTHYMTLYAYRRYLENKLYKEQMLELTRQQQSGAAAGGINTTGATSIDSNPKAKSEFNNMIKANEFLDIAKLSSYQFVESFIENHEIQGKSLEFAIQVNKYFRMADSKNAKILSRVDFVRIIQSINNTDITDSIIKDYYAKALIAFNTSSMDFKCFYCALKALINDNIIKPII